MQKTIKSKFIEILKTFSLREIKQLKEFINSTYFNKKANIRIAYEFISTHHPNYNHPSLTDINLLKKVCPSKKFDDKLLNNLLLSLLKLAQRFIVVKMVEEDGFYSSTLRLKFYKTNLLDDLFKKELKCGHNFQRKYHFKNETYFFNQYQLETLYCDYLLHHPNDSGKSVNLEKVNESFDIYVIVHKLIVLCQMVNHQEVVQYKYNFTLAEELKSFIEKGSYQDVPTIAVWYNAYCLLTKTDKLAFYATLRNLLKLHKKELSYIHKKSLYIYLQNSLGSILKDRMAYYEELFDLYVEQLEEGTIYTNGLLTSTLFKNIVVVALKLKKIKWTENFIRGHVNKLSDAEKQVYYFALAYLYFIRKAYKILCPFYLF